VTRLEDRLRADLRAESVQIEPESIPALHLPAPARHPNGKLRRWSPRHWPAWMTALAAAAAVAAVIAGTFIVGHIILTGQSRRPATEEPTYSGIPPYYAYAVQGSTYSRTINGTQYGDSVIARWVRIRDTATGKLIGTISPPAPYNAFESFAGAANGRTFVLAANRYRYTKTGNEYYKLDQRTPLKFIVVRITPGGRTESSALSLPGTLTEAQAPTLSLSPDGTKLAVAYGGSGKPAVVQLITLATGRMRQWVSPPPAATPVLGGPGTWTADGRILALGQMVIQRSGIIGSTPTQMRLLNTAAPGRSLAAASKLITLRGASIFPWPFITTDGTKLIGETTRRPVRAHAATGSGAFGVYSARTGKLLQVVARWHQHGRRFMVNRARQAVVWSDASGSRLIVEMPRGNVNEVGFLTGDTFTPLPHVALAPLLNAINSGGFQTSGGYVGFAW
jgi:hypothetical protein